jgi:hypothetical protein
MEPAARITKEHTMLLAIQKGEAAEAERRRKAEEAKAAAERKRRADGNLIFSELSPREKQDELAKHALCSPNPFASDQRPTERPASEIDDYRAATPAERRAELRRRGVN